MSRAAKTGGRLTVLASTLFGLLAADSTAQTSTPFEQVERGRYLATLGDCAACHTAAEGKPYAGGVPIETPFGRIVGANITPDRETGIGSWSPADFQRSMSQGVSKGGKHLYAAMPYPAYTKVTAQDNAAIFAYLRTLEPVNNKVETNQLPFPFSVRLSLYAWNFLNFTGGEYIADAAKDPEWNRGAYIVQGLGHCGTCHTPKTLTAGDKDGAFLKGNVIDHWLAPDITNHGDGVGKWSIEDITQYLKTGANRYDIASGPMAEVIVKSSQGWTDPDLKAVAVYLKSLGPADAAPPAVAAPDPAVMTAGREVYADRCSACHGSDGEGATGLFPKLSQAPLTTNPDATSLIRVVLAGSRAVATDARPTGPAMPAFARAFDDATVANVLTHIRNSWGNKAAPVTAAQVGKLREALKP